MGGNVRMHCTTQQWPPVPLLSTHVVFTVVLDSASVTI